MPSSLASQWRVVRHYLSQTSVGSTEQWESLIRRIEKAVTSKLLAKSDLDSIKSENILQAADAFKSTAAVDSSPAAAKQVSSHVKDDKESVAIQPAPDPVHERLSQDSVDIGSDLKSMSVEGLLEGIRLRRDLALGKISEQKKRQLPVVSKTSIHARTAYVISALVGAVSSDSLRRRSESFIQHLVQYPQARDYAIKEGGVRALLRVQMALDLGVSAEREIDGLVREALALLGHVGPCKGPGPNILSLDGGGIRGLIAIEVLKQLEKLSGRKVHELFDYIVGVSTGAIIAAVISSGVGSLDTASDMYHTLSKKMFGNTSLLGGTSRLVLTHSYYDTEAWENMLIERLGDMTLTHCSRHDTPKMALVSCVVNSGARLSPFLFRSYEMPFRVRSVYPGTTRALVWQAVRASAAAPTYFAEFHHEGLLHQDGGIMVNNPSGIALHEARLLYGPQAVRQGCLVSIGTGKPLSKHVHAPSSREATSTTWKDKFNKILDSATDTEGVHWVLNDLLPEGSYFRLNPTLNFEVAMDEIDPEKLNSLLVDAQAYMRRNRHKLQHAANMLTRRRGLTQRIGDIVQHRAHVMGVRQGY